MYEVAPRAGLKSLFACILYEPNLFPVFADLSS